MHLEVYNSQPMMLFAIKEITHVLMTKYPMNQNMAKSVNIQTCMFGSVFCAPASVGCEGVSLAIGVEICSRMGGGRSKNGNIGTPYLNHCMKKLLPCIHVP